MHGGSFSFRSSRHGARSVGRDSPGPPVLTLKPASGPVRLSRPAQECKLPASLQLPQSSPVITRHWPSEPARPSNCNLTIFKFASRAAAPSTAGPAAELTAAAFLKSEKDEGQFDPWVLSTMTPAAHCDRNDCYSQTIQQRAKSKNNSSLAHSLSSVGDFYPTSISSLCSQQSGPCDSRKIKTEAQNHVLWYGSVRSGVAFQNQ